MDTNRRRRLCRYFAKGYCRYGDTCKFSHDLAFTSRPKCRNFAQGFCLYGNLCKFYHPSPEDDASGNASVSSQEPANFEKCERCQKFILHPEDSMQRQKHFEMCLKPLECKSGSSNEKQCGICLEDVSQTASKTFGILINCTHSFCLECIREWRQRKEYETEVKQACPQCRKVSAFIIPSKFWVEESEKTKFISKYKERVGKIPCRNFKEGKGWCKFLESCIYKHQLPDGSKPDYDSIRYKRAQHRRPVLSDFSDDDDDDFFGNSLFEFDYSSFEDDDSDNYDLFSDDDDDDVDARGIVDLIIGHFLDL